MVVDLDAAVNSMPWKRNSRLSLHDYGATKHFVLLSAI